LRFKGNYTLPELQFAPHGLKLAAGQALFASACIEADRAEIVTHYWQAGYLNSSFRETATEVSKDDIHRINVVYHIYEGSEGHRGKHRNAGPHANAGNGSSIRMFRQSSQTRR
jgi:outer membrane protein assembly factor BamA